jgi:sugar O-acyltransferase (sialic acid O-acetyltransferase NeuD family)
MAKVVIFGAGKGADTAYRYLSMDSPHEICGFAVESQFLKTDRLHELPVVEYESISRHFPPDRYEMFVPLGFQQMNELRAARYLDAKSKGYRFISYLNSHHYSLERVAIGENCFILDNQIFNLDVTIGDNVTIWSGNHIGDRTTIGNHVWISSHVSLSGDVHVGEYSFLGVNSCVSNNVRIGSKSFVGANVLISQDTAAGSVHVAPAAKQIQMPSEKFLAMLSIT